MEYKDYYKILGVSRDVDSAAIKQAYRRLARKYHPDVNHEKGAEDKFKDLQEAYEVLRDDEKRRSYDQLGANWKSGQQFRPPPGWSGGNFGGQGFQSRGFSGGGAGADGFSDFFRDLFGGGMGGGGMGGGYAGPPPPQTANLSISLQDVYEGAEKTISVGHSGKRIKVRIPKSISSGQQIRLAGQADGADLHLRLDILPHPHFRVEGKDIHLDLPISPWEAALGGKVPVPTLGGTIQMSIPAGAHSGQKMRARGRGLNGGDQILHLKIVNPTLDNDAQKAAFEKLAENFQFDPRESLLKSV